MNRNIGIILIIIGAAMLIWSGFTYTTKEKVVDLGPIHVTADKEARCKLAALPWRNFPCWRYYRDG